MYWGARLRVKLGSKLPWQTELTNDGKTISGEGPRHSSPNIFGGLVKKGLRIHNKRMKELQESRAKLPYRKAKRAEKKRRRELNRKGVSSERQITQDS